MKMDGACGIKICRVCGDTALGFNFRGLSCEPCKSFFRRNSYKLEKLRCERSGRCQIDLLTRKCCTKCRLDKCIRIGMKRNLIFSRIDEQSGSSSAESDDISLPISPLLSIDHFVENQIKTQLFAVSSDSSLEFTEPLLMPLPKQIYSLELNPFEVDQILEIQLAARESSFREENQLQMIGEAVDLIYALNLTEYYVKKTIKFCKHIGTFKSLNQNDQLSMLKTFFTELLLIRFAYNFNQEKDGFRMFENESCNKSVLVPLNIIYQAKKHNMLLQCRNYSSEFQAEMEQDSILRNLIITQRLFQPNDSVSCPEYIRYQYFLYSRLLHRYLEHKYQSIEKANMKMCKLNGMLQMMMPVKNMLEGIFIETDSSKLALVLNELYNLPERQNISVEQLNGETYDCSIHKDK